MDQRFCLLDLFSMDRRRHRGEFVDNFKTITSFLDLSLEGLFKQKLDFHGWP